MGSMTGPPKMSEKEREKRKKEKELAVKMEEGHRKATKEFRDKTEAKIGQFLKDGARNKLTCPPMEKHLRGIIHDAAEVAGLVAHSFGTEENADRHVVIWKKESAPGDDELECLRRGEEWDPVRHAAVKAQEEERRKADEQRDREEASRAKKSGKAAPKASYQQKYEHLIGEEPLRFVG